MKSDKSSKLVIINGLPATGKTWLANKISTELSLPLISKDPIKVEILKQLGMRDRAWDIQIGITSVKLQLQMASEFLSKGVSLIIESNYKQAYDAAMINEVINSTQCDCLQLFCDARGEILAERYAQRVYRGERPKELDIEGIVEEFQIKLRHHKEEPLQIPGSIIFVDTNDFSLVNLNQIIEDVRSFLLL